MDLNSVYGGLSAEQWRTVQATVIEEAERTRLASSFLPNVGLLDPSVQYVPSLGLRSAPVLGARPANRLWVNANPTLGITTIASLVYLKDAELADPQLTAALTQFRRVAMLIARAEDQLAFCGQPAPGVAPTFLPANFGNLLDFRGGGANAGLLGGPAPAPPVALPLPSGARLLTAPFAANSVDLIQACADGIARLEGVGHSGPYSCVLGPTLHATACKPTPNLATARDRILPFFEGRLFRSSCLPPDYGVIVSTGGAPVEMIRASEISVRFLQFNAEPRAVFQISTRVALRIKEENAIAILRA